jgi:iron complex outermembrane receptor protein
MINAIFKGNFKDLGFISLSLAVLSPWNNAISQDSGTQSSGISALMDEVVVTARKREETLQEAPIAISAFSGESLDVRGITSIDEIGLITPNMNYQSNPQAGGSSSVATVYIRGIGQRDFLGTIDNGVGFYIDDVIIARTVGAIVDLVDVERIEILRGPQGTLFGRNNVGGAVKLHTQKPADEFGGYVDAQVGTDGMVRLKGSVDIPISDSFKSKFSILDASQDGYVDRPAGGDLGDEDVLAMRAAFLFEPNENLTIEFSGDFSKEDENGPAFTLHDAGELAPGGFPGFHNNVLAPTSCAYPGGLFTSSKACYNSQWISEDTNYGTYPTFSDTDTWGLRLGIDWLLSDTMSFKSITAYRDLDSLFLRDGDASPLRVTHFYDDFESDQFSQEFQLNTSLMDGKIDWINGLYYFKEEGKNVNLLEFAIANFISGAEFETESKAFFSQATIHINDQLDLTIGGRYTREEKKFTPDQIVGQNWIGIPYFDASGACVLQNEGANLAAGTPGLISGLPPFVCPVQIVPAGTNTRTSNEFTPMVNLAYQATDSTMIYATYAEGFRSGGFVQRIFPPLPFVPDFDPEFVESYEVGLKFASPDGGLIFNSAAFFMDYTDLQVRTENPGYIGEFEDNVGDAEIYGLELELLFQPTATTILELSYGYTHAEYTAIRVEPPLVSTVSVDDKFDHVPEHSLAAAFSKEFSLESGGLVIARIDASHSTKYPNDADNSLPIFTPDVTLVNASMRWISNDERLRVTLGGKNITDKEYVLTGYLNEAIGHAERIYDRGTEWYLSARYSF